MRVLHILDCSLPKISGYSLRSKYILENLKKMSIEVLSVTSPNHVISDGINEETINEIIYYRTHYQTNIAQKLTRRSVIIKFFLFIQTLQDKIFEIIANKGPVDIIHAHSPVLCGLSALKAGRKFKIPIIYEVRALWEDAAVDQKKTTDGSFRYILTKYYETHLLKQVSNVTVLCHGLESEMISRGIAESKIKVVPNGVDIENFHPRPKNVDLFKKYNLSDHLIFGFIGSFFKFEGLDQFIKATSQVITKNKKIKVLIIGGGKRENEIKDLVSRLNCRNQIILVDKIPHHLITQYYSIIDVLVYPRIKNRLTDLVTPLKPLEAMAMEKIILASDVGGLKELVQDKKTGILFEAGNVEDLVKKMNYIIDNIYLCMELGKNARKYVIKNRDWHKITKKYIDIYSDLLANLK